MEDCVISDCMGEGVKINFGASPLISSCKIHGSGRAGISIQNRGTAGRIIGNELWGNFGGGIVVGPSSSPTIENNYFHDHLISSAEGSGHGVYVCEGGAPCLGDDNIFLRNGAGGSFFVKARGQFYYKMGRPALLLEYVVTPRASNEN